MRKNKKRKIKFSKIIFFILVIVLTYFLINTVIEFVNKKTIDNLANGEDSKIELPQEEKQENTLDENKVLVTNEGSYFIRNCKSEMYKIGEKNLKIPVLIYHNFRTPIPYNEDVYKLFSSQENFEENVTTLLDDGYTFITLEDIQLYKEGKIGLPEKNICITVDDGQIGCYTDMFPVLKKYEIPATIFIVNTLVGTEDYFTWEMAKEMYDTGFVKIQSHGYYHDDVTQYDDQKVKKLYNLSFKEICDNIGDTNIKKIMAYPAGKSNQRTKDILENEGFTIQVQTRYGTLNNSEDLDLTNIGRIRAERATGKQLLEQIK